MKKFYPIKVCKPEFGKWEYLPEQKQERRTVKTTVCLNFHHHYGDVSVQQLIDVMSQFPANAFITVYYDEDSGRDGIQVFGYETRDLTEEQIVKLERKKQKQEKQAAITAAEREARLQWELSALERMRERSRRVLLEKHQEMENEEQ